MELADRRLVRSCTQHGCDGHESSASGQDADGGGQTGNCATVTCAGGDGSRPQQSDVSARDEDLTKLCILWVGYNTDGDTLTVRSWKPITGLTMAPVSCCTSSTNYNGSDGSTWSNDDIHRLSDVATVSITVSPVNDPPAADAQSVSTNQGTPLNITLTGTDVETAPAA